MIPYQRTTQERTGGELTVPELNREALTYAAVRRVKKDYIMKTRCGPQTSASFRFDRCRMRTPARLAVHRLNRCAPEAAEPNNEFIIKQKLLTLHSIARALICNYPSRLGHTVSRHNQGSMLSWHRPASRPASRATVHGL